MPEDLRFQIDAALGGRALASGLKRLLAERSWSQVKRLIATRHVNVNAALCVDPSLMLREGDHIEVLARSRPKPPGERDVRIVYLDEHLVIADKPPRIIALRRPEEMEWTPAQKAERPTLDELLTRMLRGRPGAPRDLVVRGVHRLDRDTSGLMLFALSQPAQEALAAMFRAHSIDRNYLAIVHGHPSPQRIETCLVRDRGDGLRGSSPPATPDPVTLDAHSLNTHSLEPRALRSVTHVEPIEAVGPYHIIRCRLETGRTH